MDICEHQNYDYDTDTTISTLCLNNSTSEVHYCRGL